MKVICGKDDIAGQNICAFLRDHFSVESINLEDHPIYHNFPERDIKAEKNELIIVPSQHRSEKNVKSLTVHAAGNFDSNDLGGFKYKMAPYDARVAKSILMNIKKYGTGLGYEITYEATHHGPFSENPIVFVEIGSTEKEYGDKEVGYIVARSIHEAFDEESEIYCGIGGLHYSEKFTRIALEEGISMGHIASKYRISSINSDVLKEMIDKTPETKGFLMEEKSFNSAQKSLLRKMLEELSLFYKMI